MSERIIFEFNDELYPIIKIEENKDVGIFFIQHNGEHITLHKKNNGVILRTHWGKDKPKSTWDKIRKKAALHGGIKNWFRHDKYYEHSKLQKTSNIKGYYLVGRRIDLSKSKVKFKLKYKNNPYKIVKTTQNIFFLNIYLSTNDNAYAKNSPFVETNFGKIYIELEKQNSIA